MKVGAGSLPAQPLRGIAPVAAPNPGSGCDLLAFLPGRTVAALVIRAAAEDGHGIVEIEGHPDHGRRRSWPAPGTYITLKFGRLPGRPADSGSRPGTRRRANRVAGSRRRGQ